MQNVSRIVFFDSFIRSNDERINKLKKELELVF